MAAPPPKEKDPGSSSFWKKFVAPPNFIKTEMQMEDMQAGETITSQLVMDQLDSLIRTTNNSNMKQQYEYLKADMLAKGLEGKANEAFVEDFFRWILGRSEKNVVYEDPPFNPNGTVPVVGEDRDIITPWGNKRYTFPDDVKDFIDTIVDERAEAIAYISKLKFRYPRNIVELWIWWKYIVHKQGLSNNIIHYARFLEPYDFIPPDKVPSTFTGKTDKEGNNIFVPVYDYGESGDVPDLPVKAFHPGNPNPPPFKKEVAQRMKVEIFTMLDDFERVVAANNNDLNESPAYLQVFKKGVGAYNLVKDGYYTDNMSRLPFEAAVYNRIMMIKDIGVRTYVLEKFGFGYTQDGIPAGQANAFNNEIGLALIQALNNLNLAGLAENVGLLRSVSEQNTPAIRKDVNEILRLLRRKGFGGGPRGGGGGGGGPGGGGGGGPRGGRPDDDDDEDEDDDDDDDDDRRRRANIIIEEDPLLQELDDDEFMDDDERSRSRIISTSGRKRKLDERYNSIYPGNPPAPPGAGAIRVAIENMNKRYSDIDEKLGVLESTLNGIANGQNNPSNLPPITREEIFCGISRTVGPEVEKITTFVEDRLNAVAGKFTSAIDTVTKKLDESISRYEKLREDNVGRTPCYIPHVVFRGENNYFGQGAPQEVFYVAGEQSQLEANILSKIKERIPESDSILQEILSEVKAKPSSNVAQNDKPLTVETISAGITRALNEVFLPQFNRSIKELVDAGQLKKKEASAKYDATIGELKQFSEQIIGRMEKLSRGEMRLSPQDLATLDKNYNDFFKRSMDDIKNLVKDMGTPNAQLLAEIESNKSDLRHLHARLDDMQKVRDETLAMLGKSTELNEAFLAELRLIGQRSDFLKSFLDRQEVMSREFMQVIGSLVNANEATFQQRLKDMENVMNDRLSEMERARMLNERITEKNIQLQQEHYQSQIQAYERERAELMAVLNELLHAIKPGFEASSSSSSSAAESTAQNIAAIGNYERNIINHDQAMIDQYGRDYNLSLRVPVSNDMLNYMNLVALSVEDRYQSEEYVGPRELEVEKYIESMFNTHTELTELAELFVTYNMAGDPALNPELRELANEYQRSNVPSVFESLGISKETMTRSFEKFIAKEVYEGRGLTLGKSLPKFTSEVLNEFYKFQALNAFENFIQTQQEITSALGQTLAQIVNTPKEIFEQSGNIVVPDTVSSQELYQMGMIPEKHKELMKRLVLAEDEDFRESQDFQNELIHSATKPAIALHRLYKSNELAMEILDGIIGNYAANEKLLESRALIGEENMYIRRQLQFLAQATGDGLGFVLDKIDALLASGGHGAIASQVYSTINTLLLQNGIVQMNPDFIKQYHAVVEYHNRTQQFVSDNYETYARRTKIIQQSVEFLSESLQQSVSQLYEMYQLLQFNEQQKRLRAITNLPHH